MGHKSARGLHRSDVTHILSKASCFFFIETLSFSQVTETIVFFSPCKSLYFECYATMPMFADAHISRLGFLWSQWLLSINQGVLTVIHILLSTPRL